MTFDTVSTFEFPAVARKKITAAFDGERISSDGGVMLLAQIERRLGIAERLAGKVPDRRDPVRVTHGLADMIRARILAIACGYEDCNDFDRLRSDPAFKVACGRLPDSGADLASQPTLSRLENAPTLRDAIRLTYALVDQWMASYETPPRSVTLDMDDTCDVVHGRQQLSLFNAHYDEYCFLPIHVYDTATGRPVAMVLRPGKTPSGVEVRAHVRRLHRRIRSKWPTTRITLRGDGHYARPEVMDFCEDNDILYLFGLAGTRPLTAKVRDMADAVATSRAVDNADVVRDFTEVRHKAKGWRQERRAVARIEATKLGLDIRFVVTNLEKVAPPRPLRDPLLRPWSGREPDQGAQGPSRLRPHLLPSRRRQSGPLGVPHRRLLADADPEGGHPVRPRSGQSRVRHHPVAPLEDRRPRPRARHPHPPRLRRRLPGGRPLHRPRRRVQAATRRCALVTNGA